jgi:hypothetical protein
MFPTPRLGRSHVCLDLSGSTTVQMRRSERVYRETCARSSAAWAVGKVSRKLVDVLGDAGWKAPDCRHFLRRVYRRTRSSTKVLERTHVRFPNESVTALSRKPSHKPSRKRLVFREWRRSRCRCEQTRLGSRRHRAGTGVIGSGWRSDDCLAVPATLVRAESAGWSRYPGGQRGEHGRLLPPRSAILQERECWCPQ